MLDDDARVLAHLRGYPEDLRHFSNLVKQAHPRGVSALRLVLSRPQASDSFVAAVCRAVAEGIPVVSAVEAAERFGLPPRRFLDEVAARPDFPRPLFASGDRRLWRADDVERYRASRPAG